MAQALGARLLDRRGEEIAPGGGALLDLARVDLSSLDRAVRSTRFIVASDVDNPLVGPSGAAAVYAPQKGAGAEDVALLERALGRYAAVLHRDLGLDLRREPGGGAAGGLGAGLIAFAGARIRPGVDVVMEAVGFDDRLAGAGLVVTGEGRFDDQSLRGKAVAGVRRSAERAGIPLVVMCGSADVRPDGLRVVSLVERCGDREARERAGACLEAASHALALEEGAGASGADLGANAAGAKAAGESPHARSSQGPEEPRH
jgi:glycerate kinase